MWDRVELYSRESEALKKNTTRMYQYSMGGEAQVLIATQPFGFLNPLSEWVVRYLSAVLDVATSCEKYSRAIIMRGVSRVIHLLRCTNRTTEDDSFPSTLTRHGEASSKIHIFLCHPIYKHPGTPTTVFSQQPTVHM